MKKTAQIKKSGFTLVELIVVISIIAILAVVVAIIINPFEIMRRGRDADRLSHLAQLQQAIAVAVQESTASAAETLCVNTTAPCSGTSDVGSRSNNGSGWVKVDLSSQQTVAFATLPIDPTNSTTYHYAYCSDGAEWEIDTVLESQRETPKMAGDGGNDDVVYEVGLNLSLIAASGGSCTY
ncbi:hypothetical protein A3B45_01865 [Candidatus Daviesbacteria bacterium RIFCSPLOWO2_01_FULL_39_12]|uniref:Uncharacterized protein n=1 Tax=Candidatus Daviesbacteria bacterium RIFCSPLOWO2_01_FULL_39_12 TaxID=1797785 RepID=A0A1F5KLX8_9BACT|nr:MAG: hypothetical protein A3D79_00980 [Candidatus Daviesbacteria bacterium RIFCSPHIGHO2_02_FULL_39_8]OGE41947.1 MAG: hypothetical protein A3B45_01865 [Candidatus Daviesbacteria bacterium RIFCSPLOWO2_01_FULL_39_12]